MTYIRARGSKFLKMLIIFLITSVASNVSFSFDNALKLSVAFKNITDKQNYFHFHGENCTTYLYRKSGNFELITTSGQDHEIYTSPLDENLYFETIPYSINGKLMSLKLRQNNVTCFGYQYLTFLAPINNLVISNFETAPIIYKTNNNHLELLSLLISVPLCIVILISNRHALTRKIAKETLV